ncbi:TIGR04222 domain-containing membrane protein [Candidatus Electronema sp. PJ]|uniref:TIGR04222 domain-containing membrane protein n=1 Tax=Candidatus Electronema sp. PJ TaxID=3401572 RepID=UPI003AA8CC18
MINFLVRIPGPVFLLYFLIFSIVCIILARLVLKQLEGADKLTLPPVSHFKPSAYAYLRGGLPEVIRTAMFSLWQKRVVVLSGNGSDAVVQCSNFSEPLPDPVEATVYAFLKAKPQGLTPPALLNDTSLLNKIEQKLRSTQDELRRLHLLRTKEEHLRAWAITWMTITVIGGVGGTKLYLGLTRARPVVFLVIFLVVALIALLSVLKPWNTVSSLGKWYLAQAASHFQGAMKKLHKEKIADGVEPAYLIAVYGTAVLSGIAAYSIFQGAFTPPSSGGCSGGSSDSSSGDSGGSSGCGGGGGCGGCGG